jgi:hypothetical protein
VLSQLVNVDPLLARESAANGGQAMTIALSSQSPAINAGDDASVPTTDQSHIARAGLSDIGTHEFQTPASVISYAWLRSYGLATNGSADQSDPDNDGLNNLAEWIAGTHPLSPSSCLKMLSPADAAPSLAVRWQSVSGKKYLIERSTDFEAQPPFSILSGNIVGQPGTTIYLDTTAVGSGPFFYRVAIQR